MMLTAEQLESVLRKAAEGDAWFGSNTTDLLAGVTARQAATRPSQSIHSIWEIVLHMTAWASEVERRLGGTSPQVPAEGDWPKIADTSEGAWMATVEAYRATNRRLGTRIREFGEARWGEVVGEERVPELGTGVSWTEMVLGVLQHNVYHTGQIGLVRKLVIASAGDDT